MVPSYNIALTLRRMRSLVTGDAFGRVVDSHDNPKRQSLSTRLEMSVIMKPNYDDLGLSVSMGQELRKEVEIQLIRDLFYYNVFGTDLRFDWSDSCIEGKSLNYLDGSLDRFSGIMIFDTKDNPVADGWMDFIYSEETGLKVYWLFLDVFIDGVWIRVKDDLGIPQHIKELIDYQ